jgi:VanZ family protein
MKKIVNALLPPIAWAALIFILSSQSVLPGIEISTLDFIAKKLAHITVYAVLYVLLYRATAILTDTMPANKRQSWLLYVPLFICFAYAISDEFHQSFIPNRFGSMRDVGYDMLGTSIAFLKIYRYI